MNLESMSDSDLRDLIAIAKAILLARKLRLAGAINRALVTERLIDDMHSQLPEHMRW